MLFERRFGHPSSFCGCWRLPCVAEERLQVWTIKSLGATGLSSVCSRYSDIYIRMEGFTNETIMDDYYDLYNMTDETEE